MSDSYYLVHHGIEGQKWGIRNGPPYPLNENYSEQQRIRDRKIYGSGGSTTNK